jgi:hypothetical protein
MFNSEGSCPSEIKDQLLNLGFKATKGNYDFVYEWDEASSKVDDLIWHSTLNKSNVYFTIETI